MPKIAMLMSGGVDSSVSALLLKNQGWDVVGVTMNLSDVNNCLDGGETKTCCGIYDTIQARAVCKILGIPHFVVNFHEVFRQKVIQPFIDGYQNGETVIPCSLCNDKIKFDYCYDYCKENFGTEYIATGHYSKIVNGELCRVDNDKDQSYFLAGIRFDVLQKLVLPLENLTKPEVREIARQNNLPNAAKRESMDICFIPNGDYREFLKKEGTNIEPGNILNQSGEVVGQHKGFQSYRIGQKLLGKFVVNIRTNNEVVVSEKRPTTKTFKIHSANLLSPGHKMDGKLTVYVRNRCAYPIQNISLVDNTWTVELSKEALNVTPGQRAVFYNEDGVVVFSGTISKES